MKATSYTTNQYGSFCARPVFAGAPLAGVTSAEAEQSAVNTGFLGLGVAVTGSSCFHLAKMEAEERRRLLRFLYTPEGLNLSVARLTVGSSDYSAEVYTYDDGEEDLALSRFSIERDRAYIIPMIRELLAVRPDLTVFASPWSPPGWMKTGGSVGGGYMRAQYLDCYADYLVKYVEAYRAEGIPIHALTPQNEPETQQGGRMPACIWHPDLEARFILILREKLDQKGLDTEIWCYDHNFSGASRVDWCMKEYPALRAACAGAAFHYYDGDVAQTTFLKKQYDLRLHFSEGGPRLYDHYDTDWCKWGLLMIRTLCASYSSFTGWNLMLDEAGGPNVSPFFCGGLITRDAQSGELSYSGQYKAMRHFSGVTPESTVYPLHFERANQPMSAFNGKGRLFTEGCLAKQPDGSAILILVNPSAEKEQIQFYYNGECLYLEMLPDTVATVQIERNATL